MLFIIPSMFAYQRQDQIIYNIVQVEVNTFSEKVREVGYIDRPMLNDFYAKIYSTGLNYSITFEHLSKVFAEDDSVMRAYYDGTYTEDIVLSVENIERYDMIVGDFFFVKVESISPTKTQSFNRLLGITSGGPGVYCVSGGVVRYGDS